MKNKKLIILIVVIILVFVGAGYFYNNLKGSQAETSYVPTIKTETATSSPVKNEVVKEEPVVDTSVDSQETPSTEEETAPSAMFPDIPVALIDGTQGNFWDIYEKGKPIVINSFASWCPPCKEELPHFIEVEAKYKDQVTFIYFDNLDGQRETEATIKEFAAKTFPEGTNIVLDPGYFGYLFSTNSIPVTVILNSDGEVVKGFQGMISKDTLETSIEELL